MYKKITKSDLQDRICELVYRTETFLKWSRCLLELYEKEKNYYDNPLEKQIKFYDNRVTKTLVLHQILYFQEVILILDTLLEKESSPEEISFKYYFKYFKNEIENSEREDMEEEIKNIRSDYENKTLEQVRNKIFAHKNVNVTGNPAVGFLNPVRKEYIKKTEKVLEKIKELVHNKFDCPFNNYFEQNYKESFIFFYELCEKILETQRKDE